MTEETFGPTLPVMRVARRRARRSRSPTRARTACRRRCGPATTSAARRSRAGSRPGSVCVNDAQLNYAALELPMGGWKESGPRLAPRRRTGSASTRSSQSILVTPGYAPSREPHHFPYSAAGERRRWARRSPLLATSDLFSDAQRATLRALCDTFIPSLDAARRASRRPARLLGAAPPRTRRSPRGSRSRCFRPSCPTSRSTGLRALLDALAENGMAAATPAEAARADRPRLLRAEPRGARRDHDAARHRGDALLRAARPRHRPQPELGRDRLPGPDRRRRPTAPRPLEMHRPEGAEEVDRGRRLHRRLGRRRRGDRRRARRGRQVGRACSRWAATTTTRDFDELELSAYQRLYLNGGPFPTAEGQVAIVAGTGVGGGTVVNWTNCLRTHDWVRAEWAREHGLEGLDRAGLRRPPRRGLGAARRQRRLLATSTGPHLRLSEACEKLGYDFRPITRNADPASATTPSVAGLHGLRRPVRLEAVDREDLPGRRPARRRRRSSADCRVERILVEDGRAAGVEAVYAIPRRPATAAARPRGSIVRAPVVVVACGSIESPGAAAALGDRRPGGRRLPAPAPDGRGHRLLRRAAELDAGARRRRRSRTSSPTSRTATAS